MGAKRPASKSAAAKGVTKKSATAKRPAVKRSAAKSPRAAATMALAPELARRVADAAEAAGSERLLAVERAADQLRRYLSDYRPTLLVVAPLLLAGTQREPQLILEADLSFRVISFSGRGRATLDRVSAVELVELWGAADLYDRIEAALRSAAGLKSRPTGAIVAGLGVAGDRGAKV